MKFILLFIAMSAFASEELEVGSVFTIHNVPYYKIIHPEGIYQSIDVKVVRFTKTDEALFVGHGMYKNILSKAMTYEKLRKLMYKEFMKGYSQKNWDWVQEFFNNKEDRFNTWFDETQEKSKNQKA